MKQTGTSGKFSGVHRKIIILEENFVDQTNSTDFIPRAKLGENNFD